MPNPWWIGAIPKPWIPIICRYKYQVTNFICGLRFFKYSCQKWASFSKPQFTVYMQIHVPKHTRIHFIHTRLSTGCSQPESQGFSPYNSSYSFVPPRKKTGAGFSHNKVDFFLDVIEEVLPLGQGEWDIVERQHHSMYPDAGRTWDTLKKVCKLYLKKFQLDTQPVLQ